MKKKSILNQKMSFPKALYYLHKYDGKIEAESAGTHYKQTLKSIRYWIGKDITNYDHMMNIMWYLRRK